MKSRAKLLGYSIDTYDFESAIEYAKKACGQVVTINPEMMSNSEMADIVNSAELVIPDGIGVEIGLKISGYNVKRIPGIQFAHRLLEECAKDGSNVALVGAKPEVIKKTCENLKNEFENLNITYSQDGYYKDENSVLEDLKNSNARLILCALGSPKQEYFIQKAKKLLPNSLFIGVGGSFDVWAGAVKRAPEMWQNLGLEWLYRTLMEPERLKRIFPALPLFVLRVLKERYIPKGV